MALRKVSVDMIAPDPFVRHQEGHYMAEPMVYLEVAELVGSQLLSRPSASEQQGGERSSTTMMGAATFWVLGQLGVV
jgi:hypothetical protein